MTQKCEIVYRLVFGTLSQAGITKDWWKKRASLLLSYLPLRSQPRARQTSHLCSSPLSRPNCRSMQSHASDTLWTQQSGPTWQELWPDVKWAERSRPAPSRSESHLRNAPPAGQLPTPHPPCFRQACKCGGRLLTPLPGSSSRCHETWGRGHVRAGDDGETSGPVPTARIDCKEQQILAEGLQTAGPGAGACSIGLVFNWRFRSS